MTSRSKPELELREITIEDIPEVATVFTRSFHPISAYMRKAFPDTPTIQQWWIGVHRWALEDPNVRMMKVIDKNDSDAIAAICRWRFSRDGDTLDAGTWSRYPLSEDHDHEKCNAFIDFMAEQRSRLMPGRPHVMIELLLAVHEYKGVGAGKMLVQRVCKDADDAEMECFVETNKDVVTFYEQLGFKVGKKANMPGGTYEEFVLTKPAKMSATSAG